MSKTPNMLRMRRRDNNVKPNRRLFDRLDRKSSRGMLYENEELRLKTININAEIERGQSDIKKLKRENDQLRREIWYLRDEYDKLDRLLRDKEDGCSLSSTTCSSEDSCGSCTEGTDELETSQNLENVQKTTTLKILNQELDVLSVVPEETSNEEGAIQPDQSYPSPGHFFAPLRPDAECGDLLPPLAKSGIDILAKTDNHNFDNGVNSTSSFSNGGNLEELLNDIETISKDILKMSGTDKPEDIPIDGEKPYKSELSVVLMPTPMQLIETEKYKNLHKSAESVNQMEPLFVPVPPMCPSPAANEQANPFYFSCPIKTIPNNNKAEANLLDPVCSENEENRLKTAPPEQPPPEKKKQAKLSIRRRVSIHFKGKKKKGAEQPTAPKTPSIESTNTIQTNGDIKSSSSTEPQQNGKSESASPERKLHQKKCHKKHKRSERSRPRPSIFSADRFGRERSFSVCTDRSNILTTTFDDFAGSDRERTNSGSSCDSTHGCKHPNLANVTPFTGKIPWCACWGNGCL